MELATLHLDTYKIVKLLQEKGYSESEAEGFIEAIQEITLIGVSTKQDISDLKQDINDLRESTKKDIDDLREGTRQDISDLKQDISDLKESTRKDIDDLRESTRVDIEDLRNSTKQNLLNLETRLTDKITILDNKIVKGLSDNLKFQLVQTIALVAVMVTLFQLFA